jgi:hypothetical protein
MPISLENTSNIRVTYNTGSNYIIETVKSDLYVRDTVGTTSNLFAEPTVVPSITPVTTGNHKTLTFPLVHNIVAYYSFNNSSSLGIDSNPSTTKYNLTPTIVGGTGGYNTSIYVEGASFQATNDGDYLEGSFPIRTIYDNSTSGISVSCWFYKKSGTTYDNPYNMFLYDFYTNINDKSFAVSLGHYNGVNVINWAATYLTYGSEVYCSAFGPQQTLDTWYHLVISFNKSGILKAYVNGINLNLSNTSGTPRINTSGSSVYPMPQFPDVSKLRIFNPSTSGYKFSGNIDEFYVFNKELSQTEITSLYNKSYSVFSTYTLTFPFRTVTDINNNSNLILQGNYNVNVGFPTSSVLPAITNTSNRLIPLPNTTTSTVSLRYHTLNPVKTKEGAQWTYSSTNPNVYHLGSVGIGTTSPEYSLDVRGFIYSSSGGYTSSALTKWSVLSDRRIKENIVKASYDKCLENVKNIELYNFNFKDNYVNTNDRHQLGFIAQEVQQIYPKAVEVSRMIMNLEEKIDDLLTLNTTQIDYTLYGSVKCLIQKLENIKIKMEQIKTVYNITT